MLVKLRFSYRNRDGSERSILRAEKRFRKLFVPQIGTAIQVESDDCGVRGRVSDVWWRMHAGSEEIIVHTDDQVYSDGDVDESHAKHVKLLESDDWICRSVIKNQESA